MASIVNAAAASVHVIRVAALTSHDDDKDEDSVIYVSPTLKAPRSRSGKYASELPTLARQNSSRMSGGGGDTTSSTHTTRPFSVQSVRPKGYQSVGKPTGVRVLASKEELTAEWLTEVFRLKKFLPPEGTVDEIKCITIGEGQGEMGDLALVNVEKVSNVPDESAVPKCMVAKMYPQNNTSVLPILLRQVYLNEAHFYNDFSVKGGALPRPECLHCGAELSLRKKPKFIFLLENALMGSYGVDGKSLQYQRTDGCDNVGHLMMVMDGLASFHARWWGFNNSKKPLKWAGHPLRSLGGLVRNSIPFLSLNGLKLLPKLMEEQKHADGTPVAKWGHEYESILAWLPKLRGRFRYITRQLLRHPLTLTHGDCHLENVFFHERYQGGCAFIDFGNMRFGHALSDVSFFVATCLEPEVRRKLERDLIRRYHTTLLAHGVKDYSFDLCWHDYKMQIWMAFVQLVTQAPDFLKQRKTRTGMFAPESQISKANAQLLKMYYTQNRRCAEALKDHDWIGMVEDTKKACFGCNYMGCACEPP